MAWTHVRYGRGSFASQAPANIPSTAPTLPFVGWLTGVFIVTQIVEFMLLWQDGRFDPVFAICQSASLLAVALMFAKQRAANDDVPPPAQTEKSTTAFAAPQTAGLATAILIDEQSQTWADLMARISHEIRTPLNAVIGFSDLMEREIFGPLGNDKYRDYLAHIRDSGEALLKSAEDTLALSSLLAIPAPGQRKQSSSLSCLAKDAWLLVEPLAARRGVMLDITVSDTIEVAGDRRAFRQALTNLLVEATLRANPDSRIEIKAWPQGDTVRVKVIAADAERKRRSSEPSLAICVARALLELQGSSLVATDCARLGMWKATTVLDLAVQQDFFSAIDQSVRTAVTA
ncbi:MAG: HAMP domain-containing sensor histidine kinase [Hyphomicrobiaceae bacterium]